MDSAIKFVLTVLGFFQFIFLVSIFTHKDPTPGAITQPEPVKVESSVTESVTSDPRLSSEAAAQPPEGIEVIELPRRTQEDIRLFDVKVIAGANRKQVDRLLGKARECHAGDFGLTCEYADNNQVTFIQGRADWIRLSSVEGIPFKPSSLRLIGLTPVEPTFKNEVVMRWENRIFDWPLVEFHGSSYGVSYLVIHAFTAL